MFRSVSEVERVQEIEDSECKYTCDQVNGESCNAEKSFVCDCVI